MQVFVHICYKFQKILSDPHGYLLHQRRRDCSTFLRGFTNYEEHGYKMLIKKPDIKEK